MGKERKRHVERRLDRASFRLATLLKAAGAVLFLKRAWEHNGGDGSREEAEAMLDQMQDMFENILDADEESDVASERAMRKQMNELDKLLRDQQALRDDRFRRDQCERDRKRSQRSANPPGQKNEAQADIGPGETDCKTNPSDANPDKL